MSKFEYDAVEHAKELIINSGFCEGLGATLGCHVCFTHSYRDEYSEECTPENALTAAKDYFEQHNQGICESLW